MDPTFGGGAFGGGSGGGDPAMLARLIQQHQLAASLFGGCAPSHLGVPNPLGSIDPTFAAYLHQQSAAVLAAAAAGSSNNSAAAVDHLNHPMARNRLSSSSTSSAATLSPLDAAQSSSLFSSFWPRHPLSGSIDPFGSSLYSLFPRGPPFASPGRDGCIGSPPICTTSASMFSPPLLTSTSVSPIRLTNSTTGSARNDSVTTSPSPFSVAALASSPHPQDRFFDGLLRVSAPPPPPSATAGITGDPCLLGSPLGGGKSSSGPVSPLHASLPLAKSASKKRKTTHSSSASETAKHRRLAGDTSSTNPVLTVDPKPAIITSWTSSLEKVARGGTELKSVARVGGVCDRIPPDLAVSPPSRNIAVSPPTTTATSTVYDRRSLSSSVQSTSRHRSPPEVCIPKTDVVTSTVPSPSKTSSGSVHAPESSALLSPTGPPVVSSSTNDNEDSSPEPKSASPTDADTSLSHSVAASVPEDVKKQEDSNPVIKSSYSNDDSQESLNSIKSSSTACDNVDEKNKATIDKDSVETLTESASLGKKDTTSDGITGVIEKPKVEEVTEEKVSDTTTTVAAQVVQFSETTNSLQDEQDSTTATATAAAFERQQKTTVIKQETDVYQVASTVELTTALPATALPVSLPLAGSTTSSETVVKTEFITKSRSSGTLQMAPVVAADGGILPVLPETILRPGLPSCNVSSGDTISSTGTILAPSSSSTTTVMLAAEGTQSSCTIAAVPPPCSDGAPMIGNRDSSGCCSGDADATATTTGSCGINKVVVAVTQQTKVQVASTTTTRVRGVRRTNPVRPVAPKIQEVAPCAKVVRLSSTTSGPQPEIVGGSHVTSSSWSSSSSPLLLSQQQQQQTQQSLRSGIVAPTGTTTAAFLHPSSSNPVGMAFSPAAAALAATQSVPAPTIPVGIAVAQQRQDRTSDSFTCSKTPSDTSLFGQSHHHNHHQQQQHITAAAVSCSTMILTAGAASTTTTTVTGGSNANSATCMDKLGTNSNPTCLVAAGPSTVSTPQQLWPSAAGDTLAAPPPPLHLHSHPAAATATPTAGWIAPAAAPATALWVGPAADATHSAPTALPATPTGGFQLQLARDSLTGQLFLVPGWTLTAPAPTHNPAHAATHTHQLLTQQTTFQQFLPAKPTPQPITVQGALPLGQASHAAAGAFGYTAVQQQQSAAAAALPAAPNAAAPSVLQPQTTTHQQHTHHQSVVSYFYEPGGAMVQLATQQNSQNNSAAPMATAGLPNALLASQNALLGGGIPPQRGLLATAATSPTTHHHGTATAALSATFQQCLQHSASLEASSSPMISGVSESIMQTQGRTSQGTSPFSGLHQHQPEVVEDRQPEMEQEAPEERKALQVTIATQCDMDNPTTDEAETTDDEERHERQQKMLLSSSLSYGGCDDDSAANSPSSEDDRLEVVLPAPELKPKSEPEDGTEETKGSSSSSSAAGGGAWMQSGGERREGAVELRVDDTVPVLATQSTDIKRFIDHHGLDLLVDSIEAISSRAADVTNNTLPLTSTPITSKPACVMTSLPSTTVAASTWSNSHTSATTTVTTSSASSTPSWSIFSKSMQKTSNISTIKSSVAVASSTAAANEPDEPLFTPSQSPVETPRFSVPDFSGSGLGLLCALAESRLQQEDNPAVSNLAQTDGTEIRADTNVELSNNDDANSNISSSTSSSNEAADTVDDLKKLDEDERWKRLMGEPASAVAAAKTMCSLANETSTSPALTSSAATGFVADGTSTKSKAEIQAEKRFALLRSRESPQTLTLGAVLRSPPSGHSGHHNSSSGATVHARRPSSPEDGAHVQNMRSQLADLQRRYKERQRELLKLQHHQSTLRSSDSSDHTPKKVGGGNSKRPERRHSSGLHRHRHRHHHHRRHHHDDDKDGGAGAGSSDAELPRRYSADAVYTTPAISADYEVNVSSDELTVPKLTLKKISPLSTQSEKEKRRRSNSGGGGNSSNNYDDDGDSSRQHDDTPSKKKKKSRDKPKEDMWFVRRSERIFLLDAGVISSAQLDKNESVATPSSSRAVAAADDADAAAPPSFSNLPIPSSSSFSSPDKTRKKSGGGDNSSMSPSRSALKSVDKPCGKKIIVDAKTITHVKQQQQRIDSKSGVKADDSKPMIKSIAIDSKSTPKSMDSKFTQKVVDIKSKAKSVDSKSSVKVVEAKSTVKSSCETLNSVAELGHSAASKSFKDSKASRKKRPSTGSLSAGNTVKQTDSKAISERSTVSEKGLSFSDKLDSKAVQKQDPVKKLDFSTKVIAKESQDTKSFSSSIEGVTEKLKANTESVDQVKKSSQQSSLKCSSPKESLKSVTSRTPKEKVNVQKTNVQKEQPARSAERTANDVAPVVEHCSVLKDSSIKPKLTQLKTASPKQNISGPVQNLKRVHSVSEKTNRGSINAIDSCESTSSVTAAPKATMSKERLDVFPVTSDHPALVADSAHPVDSSSLQKRRKAEDEQLSIALKGLGSPILSCSGLSCSSREELLKTIGSRDHPNANCDVTTFTGSCLQRPEVMSVIIDPQDPDCGCRLTDQDLKTGTRVIVQDEGLFYLGEVTEIQPPDVYGVILDNERRSKPHIFSREEVLRETLKEVRATALPELKIGQRVCAFWSQQYKCLYPGRVAKSSSEEQPQSRLEVYVEFDDDDSGKISIDDIRLLPRDYPQMKDAPPSLVLNKGQRRRRVTTTDASTHEDDHDEHLVVNADNNDKTISDGASGVTTTPKRKRRKCRRNFTRKRRIRPRDLHQGTSGAVTSDASDQENDDEAKTNEEPKMKRAKKLKRKDEVSSVRPKKITMRIRTTSTSSDGEAMTAKVVRVITTTNTSDGDDDDDDDDDDNKNRNQHKGLREKKSDGAAADTAKEKKKQKNRIKSKAVISSSSSSSEDDDNNDDNAVAGSSSSSSDSSSSSSDDDDDDDDSDDERVLWEWQGEPVRVHPPKGKGRREYFEAIVRANEVIKVGECAVFMSSGRPQLPYIGRIVSLWRTWAGNMHVRVCWFYHPEETKGLAKNLKHPKFALFESPHADDNDVQTISRKCEVITHAQFKAQSKMAAPMEDVYFLAGNYDPYKNTIEILDGLT